LEERKVQLLKEVELLTKVELFGTSAMAKTVYFPDAYYHIYNRGANRLPIFFADHNWGFFIRRLREYFTEERADIIAYCLMLNHFHLLVRVVSDNFSFDVMQPFGTSYTKAINKEQRRVGSLFQGRFKGKHVDKEGYLIRLSRYIHRNPVDAGLVAQPADWVYSSYREYLGLRKGTLPKPEVILSQFASVKDYAVYVEEGDDEYGKVEHLLFE
jgi:REP element-mobilizing transposase RayT